MQSSLNDRLALIIGGSGSIGAATARLFASAGARRGQFATIHTFTPMLKASGDGLIVSISSIAGQTGIGSSIAYCAVKAGIDVVTKSLARALAPEIRVMAVAHSVVDTDFVPGRGAEFNTKTAVTTPLRRIVSPEDVAEAVLACAISLRFSTGTTLVVDGGRSL